MKTERFNNAMTALTQAFFNGTLIKGDCRACAVGNMVASANDIKVPKIDKLKELGEFDQSQIQAEWKYLGASVEDRNGKIQLIRQFLAEHKLFGMCIFDSSIEQVEKALALVDKTGYTEAEILKIESAFENGSQIDGGDYCNHTQAEIMADQYNGLCAVVDVLCKLDGIEPTEQKEFFTYDEQFKPVHQYV